MIRSLLVGFALLFGVPLLAQQSSPAAKPAAEEGLSGSVSDESD
jgi:hypothetical protein